MNLKEIYYLFAKEVLLERRQKYALGGIILYVFATLYIIRTGIPELENDFWISLFWIVMIFASVNAAAKSFVQEDKSRMMYYYQVTSAENVLFSKFLYNCLLLALVAVLALAGFGLLFGFPVESFGFFLCVVALGVFGFAAAFTLISAIASKATGTGALMAVLSIPVVLPQLSLLIMLSRKAVQGMPLDKSLRELIILFAINLIIVIVSYLLFPYLWRE